MEDVSQSTRHYRTFRFACALFHRIETNSRVKMDYSDPKIKNTLGQLWGTGECNVNKSNTKLLKAFLLPNHFVLTNE